MDKAALTISNLLRKQEAQVFKIENIRPTNNKKVVSVPLSASNFSSKGVRARMFMKAWKKPAWIRGKVFVLYTVEECNISYNPRSFCVCDSVEGIHVPNPISFGINANGCCTSQTKLKSHRSTMMNIIQRVNKGSRNI